MLDVRGRSCLVVGAGPVGTRKAAGLVEEGADVTLVALAFSAAAEALAGVRTERRSYVRADVDGKALVIAATGDPVVNQQVYDDARVAGVWVNCADEPQRCSFILPAVVRRGPVVVSVSTGGASPALAQWLRDRLAAALPSDIEGITAELSRRRRAVQEAGRSTEGMDWTAVIEELVAAAARDPSGL